MQSFTVVTLQILICSTFLISDSVAFSVVQRIVLSSEIARISTQGQRIGSRILMNKDSSDSIENDKNDNDDADVVVTKEMFMKALLEDDDEAVAPANTDGKSSALASSPDEITVKRKRKKGRQQYKVLDNRDILPFSVVQQTPDPYTHPQIKQKNAVQQAKKSRRDAVEHNIASTLYFHERDGNKMKKKNGPDNTRTLIGEFSLDKLTTTGDILQVGPDGKQYKVMRHRCQYKYAGGQKFVMVRKILEVKEVGRVATEQYLKRQFQTDSTESDEADE